MKKLIYLLFCLGLFACEDDPCDGITCLNGGTCASGTCNCPDGYEGADCSQQLTPTRITIKSIAVTKFPSTDSNGATWDPSNDADIYVELSLNGTVLADNRDSALIDKVTVPTGWMNLPPGFEIDEPTSSQYALRLYDADDTPLDDDYISGIMFTPYTGTSGFPEIILVACPVCDLAFALTLGYEF